MRYLLTLVLVLCASMAFAQTKTTSVYGKVIPNFQNNTVDIYSRSGQKQTVPLYGVTVDPRQAAKANKEFIDKYKSQDYSNVRMYTDRYGQSQVQVNGTDLGKSLNRRGYAAPNSQCAGNTNSAYCRQLRQ